MGDKTGIEWTDSTWNPIVGCSIVSPGCTNCYAMAQAARIVAMQPTSHYAGTTQPSKAGAVWTSKVALAPDHILTAPLRWKRARRIFVNSMGDLFHEAVPDDWIDKVFAIMARCPQHQFQVLTKRSKRMREYATIASDMGQHWLALREVDEIWPLPNVWLGVSAEDQARADERIPDLLATPAAVRFVSAEPLLGPIDFSRFGPVDQIIVGGESGTGFRPMQIEWAEDIMRQCREAGTAFFFKQDSHHRSGQRGQASAAMWACKQMPLLDGAGEKKP